MNEDTGFAILIFILSTLTNIFLVAMGYGLANAIGMSHDASGIFSILFAIFIVIQKD